MPIDTGSRIEFSCFFLTILTNGRMNESDELQSGLSLVKQAGQEIIKGHQKSKKKSCMIRVLILPTQFI